MYAVLSMFDYNWKQQRNNKTTKTNQPLDKNKNLKQCKQANKKTKKKQKKNTKTGFVTEIARQKDHLFLTTSRWHSF